MFNNYRFCSNENFNLTWSFHELPDNDNFLFDKELNKFVGIAIFLVINHFFLIRRNENIDTALYKNCKFLISKTFGEKLTNSSEYTGTIGAIISSAADISLRPSDYYIMPNLVDFTPTFRPSSYLAVQLIDDKKTDISKQSFKDLYYIFAPTELFLIYWFIIFWSTLIIATYVYRLSNRNLIKRNSFLIILLELPNKKLKSNPFGLFFIGFNLFVFIILQIISNNIRSSIILVDTSDLINSEEKLIQTNKQVCFLEDGQETDYFKYSPTNTLASLIYRKKLNKFKPCFIIDKNQKFHTITETSKYFTLIYTDVVKIKIKFIENIFAKNSYVNQIPFFEVLRTIYVRRRMSREMKKFVDNCVYVLIEQAFITWLFEDAEQFNVKNDKGQYKTFYKLDDYIEEHSLSANLTYESFDALFKLFFVFNFLLILILIIQSFFYLIKSTILKLLII